MISSGPIKISLDVHWVGVNDTKIGLFEAIWEIPEGVSYNSYLVQGSEKVALIDSVHKNYLQEHIDKIRSLIDPSKIDYIIINHMEPDHTSAIPELLELAPNAQLVLTPLALTIYSKYYKSKPRSLLVKGDNMEIALGGKTLRFMQTPWLHWPETMSTYLAEDRILFCCDAFGAFSKLPNNSINEKDIANIDQFIETSSKKYFATVFYGQREWVLKALEKFQQLNIYIRVLAPSHGPVYTDSIRKVLDKWAAWSKNSYTNKVVVAYGSMYGMTAKCIGPIAEAVKEAGGKVVTINLSEKPASEVITELVDSPALIIGCPTYEHEIFPRVKQFIDILQVKKFSNRQAAIFGSFSWSGEAARKLNEQLTALGFKLFDKPVIFLGEPTEQDIEKVKALANGTAKAAFTENELGA